MMKSAYELAMERLDKAQGPTRKLTDDQKAAISGIESKYQARVAETKLGYESRIAAAENYEQQSQLRAEMADDLQRLESRFETDKASVWDAE